VIQYLLLIFLFVPSISVYRKIFSSPLANNDAPVFQIVQRIAPEFGVVLTHVEAEPIAGT
jgi:hypothetical protein